MVILFSICSSQQGMVIVVVKGWDFLSFVDWSVFLLASFMMSLHLAGHFVAIDQYAILLIEVVLFTFVVGSLVLCSKKSKQRSLSIHTNNMKLLPNFSRFYSFTG